MLICECTMRSYAVRIDDDDFLVLLDADENCGWDQLLSVRLDAMPGVQDTEYNGHFGPYVFFSIEADKDTEARRNQITAKISSHINRCKRKKP